VSPSASSPTKKVKLHEDNIASLRRELAAMK
jgi:hypothetical protein